MSARRLMDVRSRKMMPAGPEPPPAASTAAEVGNSAPLALAAFAVPTFMLSAVNIGCR